jgi:hypothetical protein
MHLWLATDLRPAHADRRGPDEDERLTATAMPWRVAVAMAEAGEIQDAKSLVGLLWLARLRDRILQPPAGPDALELPIEATDAPLPVQDQLP